MQGVNFLNTTEILGNPSWAINLIKIGFVHNNHRSNFYDYNYDY